MIYIIYSYIKFQLIYLLIYNNIFIIALIGYSSAVILINILCYDCINSSEGEQAANPLIALTSSDFMKE